MVINARLMCNVNTEAAWELVEDTFIPLAGELVIYSADADHDYERVKVGDGVKTLAALKWFDYKAFGDLPIKVTQKTYENDQTGTAGAFLGQTFYKIADDYASLEQMIGGSVGNTPMTSANTMDGTSTLAGMGLNVHGVFFSPSSFDFQPPNYDFSVISIDGAVSVPAYYTDLPSAGVWVKGTVASVSLKPVVDINEKYKTFYLPEVTAEDKGSGLGVSSSGKWTLCMKPPITGIASWKQFQRLIKLGHGASLFPLFSCLSVYSSTQGTLSWMVLGHDAIEDPDDSSAHTVVLQQVNGVGRKNTEYGYGYAFDETEAIATFANGLTAGSYYVNVGGTDRGFTLTEDIPADGVLQFGPYSNMGTQISSYDEVGGTLIETVAVTDGDTSGTDLASVSGVTLNGNANDNYWRGFYGSGNYKQSNIRQFMNAVGTGWFEPKTPFDMSPDYVNEEGYLGTLDPEFVAVLLSPVMTTSTNNVYEYDTGDGMSINSSYTTADKLFLLSYTQVGGQPWGNPVQADEDTLLPAFNGLSYGNEPERVKVRQTDETTTVWWWLRSPSPSRSCYVRVVDLGGGADTSGYACGRDFALAPACVI